VPLIDCKITPKWNRFR